MARLTVILAATAALLIDAACGGSQSTSPSPPPPRQASVAVTAAPNPAAAVNCSPLCVSSSGVSYQFRVTGALTIQETAGVAGNVDSIASGTLVYTAADVVQRSGTNHVAARGSLTFPLNFVYGSAANANATRAMVFPLVVSFTDDNGNHLTAVTQWTVD